MKILHVAESARGGVGSYLASCLAHQIATLGSANVRLIAPAQHREQMSLLPEGVEAPFDRSGRTLRSLFEMARVVAREVAGFRPEVIHVHSTFAGLVVRAMYGPRRRRPAIVYCPHGWSFNVDAAAWKMTAMAMAERAMAYACDGVVAISRFEAEEAHRVGIEPRKVRLITSGIPEAPASAPASWDDGRLKVLFVGRLDRQKGVDVLLAAVAPRQDDVCVRNRGRVRGRRRGERASVQRDHAWLARRRRHLGPDAGRGRRGRAVALGRASVWPPLRPCAPANP